MVPNWPDSEKWVSVYWINCLDLSLKTGIYQAYLYHLIVGARLLGWGPLRVVEHWGDAVVGQASAPALLKQDRKSTRLNSVTDQSRMPSSA